MKLLYISIYKSYKKNKELGVAKKIELEIKQFRKAGIDIKAVDYRPKVVSFAGVQFFSAAKCESVPDLDRYDAVYIRFASVSLSLIQFIRKYKRQRPNGKVLLEIPTYPYKDEMCSQRGRLYYAATQLGMFALHFYLDRFVLISSGYASLMNVPAINIRNFTDYDAIAVRKPDESTDAINIVCVASFNNWHGYDRLIEGLKEYLRLPEHEKVMLHMVGDLKKVQGIGLSQLVREYGLGQNVIFHGVLTGKKLDAVYDMCDLACGSFGLHRIGLDFASSLKTREYAAKGIPLLVSSGLDMEDSDTERYICHFPPDESPIDFEKLVCFYHTVYDGKDKQDIAYEIRSRFEKYCSADTCFKSVVQFVLNHKS